MTLLPKNETERNKYAERFEDYFGGFPPFSISAYLQKDKELTMPVDIYETNGNIVAVCDLPGIEKKEDIIIDIQDGKNLKVVATRGDLGEFEGKRVLQKERLIGRVDRTITLPTDVDIDKTQANYKNGVLTITMEKHNPGIEQKVDIQFED